MAGRKTVRRICLIITPELDRKIVDLRKKPEYERKSLSEIARMMMERGIAMETLKNPPRDGRGFTAGCRNRYFLRLDSTEPARRLAISSR